MRHMELTHDQEQMWVILRTEALALAEREPVLAPLLDQVFLSTTSLLDALVVRLASLLAATDADEETCKRLLWEGVECDPSVSQAAVQDLYAIHVKDPACGTHLHAFLNYKAFHAVQLHRIAHCFWNSGRHELAAWLSNRVSRTLGPDIHPAARLGTGVMLDHGSGIVIGETAVVEDDVTILQNVTLGGTGKVAGDRHPKVRRGVMIGAGANILGNVEIGAFSMIGAGSVVLKDVPPWCSVAGVPAQIVRLHPENEFARGANALGSKTQDASGPEPSQTVKHPFLLGRRRT